MLNEISIGINMLGETSLEGFFADEKLKRASGMTIINIGELIKSISDDTRTKYKHIPWKAIAGFRDITAHKYQTLRMEDVYNTMKNELKEIEKLLIEVMEESGK